MFLLRIIEKGKTFLKIVKRVPCGLIPGLFRLSSLPFGNSCDVFGSHLRSPISFTSRPIAALPFLSHDELLEEGR
jgi:hypothetical protein